MAGQVTVHVDYEAVIVALMLVYMLDSDGAGCVVVCMVGDLTFVLFVGVGCVYNGGNTFTCS